ncbi:hypothetical protein BWQ96_08191 [Gracilariopsis chorda]|uniref:DUF1415 domain-containing protein n=1 Tax=Gracilariopsis chorda TaxID=448386 RepID=A0A2V3IJ06_9FLOR|nr:hypothetical protein BWQ96_08191 [Gracilariopsis chorda]|eukprot:PXF42085.1 hypothetical protein BWQ96_08191 [Gracilariopsis chorda]
MRCTALPPQCAESVNQSDSAGFAARGTMNWVRRIVIEKGLCPFAEPAVDSDRVRLVVSSATCESTARDKFYTEVRLLMSADPDEIVTTLIVMPDFATTDFLRFHEFASDIEDEISEDVNLVDAVLIAAFHPMHRYEGMGADSALNFEKRAPYPTINILRTPLLDDYISQGRTMNIPHHNKQVLEKLGSDKLKLLYQLCVQENVHCHEEG